MSEVFTLDVQLKTFMSKVPDLTSGPATDSEKSQSSDPSSASFGFRCFSRSGFPCRIGFSSAGIRDIYLIPVTRGISGKLILAEKHPFQSQRGIVIAIAPLAGLSPKIDEDHLTWLHLRIKEFDPRSNASNTRVLNAKKSYTAVDGRWTLGFTSAKACEAARMFILEETRKQRSLVESLLAPFLQNNYLENLFDTQVG
ncbi:protein TRANSPARENT TESTA 9-like isoform X3 [Mangifera indica]|uniref:protein TRANSPARENT TESTA 9-like isoform X3 n=1 Tax=Mangifera indica TaxID=29780 RepID=UPI001CFC3709|nr:protein TRANSPARENT TESTA 9-like isoform X3 [Mangifera indica]